MKHFEDFYTYALKRHQIYISRSLDEPRSEWTDDPILKHYRFTNVFRELDKTTVWYRENVREKYDGTPSVFLATILFRWFNRISTGEALFNQVDASFAEPVAAAWLAGKAGAGDLKRAITAFCGKGPYVTGAYIITSPAGMSKLDGVIQCCEWMRKKESAWNRYFSMQQRSLFDTWDTLRHEKHMGPFMAYEVVTDLRHTHLLRQADDIYTWANPGPGAKRGLMRVFGHPITHRGEKILFTTKQCIEHMRTMMELINEKDEVRKGWWPKWEMRDVEHTLCEFDKYERVRTGLGRPRGVYV